MPLAGHMIHLDPDTIGILEQHRVVARREPRAVTGRMHDARAELLDDEAMDLVDVFPPPRAQAKVMKPAAQLVEGSAALPCGHRAHEYAGAAADAIDGVLVLDERPHLEKVTKLLPEREAACGVVHRQLNVRNAV